MPYSYPGPADDELRQRIEHLLEHLPAGVVVHGPDGRLRSCNRLARELLGRAEADLIGSEADAATWDFVRADNTPMAPGEYPVNVVLRTREKLRDLVVGVPSGLPEPRRWLICNAYPECDADGNLYQVVVCFTDCTPLHRAKARLERSEERLRLVLRGSTDAPWDWDLAAGEAYYSDRWWNMLGYRPGELPDGPDLWMQLAHPADKPALTDLIEQLFADRRETYAIECRLRHRDGHYVPVLARGFVLRNTAGKPVRIAGTNTDLTERKAAEQRIHELSHFDQLTGLPNRRSLIDELQRVLARSSRSGQFGAVLALDLDNFKLINESMGHACGDELLRQVADRLRGMLRQSDQLSRLGADEFAVVLEELGKSAGQAVAEASQVTRKILEVLDRPFALSGGMVPNRSSIGVTVFDGATSGVDAVLKQAGLAMVRAKASRSEAVCFFDPGMQAAADRQAALASGLRDADSMRQFVLFCQPQFSGKGRLIGGEVLVRWRQPDGSLLGPASFIDLAESSGLIVPLGLHVLEESCRALARWRGDPALGRLKLGVNVSVHQLRDRHFPDTVAAVLEATGAPPDKLWLELTESVFAEDTVALSGIMCQMREQGVHFSLDDFGTGYSSLAYLRRFPLAGLKIDRSFVHDVHTDPNAAPIVKAIIALARTLKLDIVAEGVEYEAQRSFLIERGCYALQGFLLGRPMPIEDFEQAYRSGAALPAAR